MGNSATKTSKATGREICNSTTSIHDSLVGVCNSGSGNVTLNDLTINQITQHRSKEKLSGFNFQLEDPVNTFQGRLEELNTINSGFKNPIKNELNLFAICGYGGIGKTQLAKKYIQKNKTKYENIIWINSESEDTLKNNFETLQKELKERNYHCSQMQDIYTYFNSEKCIFIFDNSEDLKSIRDFLPKQLNKSRFLITTQKKSWNPFKLIKIDKIDSKSAQDILVTVFESHNVKISNDLIQKVLEKSEYIPLCLQITAGLICQKVIDCRDIGLDYNMEKIIEEIYSDNELVKQEFPSFSFDSYQISVFDAIFRSLNKIFDKNDFVSNMAADILGISAYLDVDQMYYSDLMNLLQCEDKGLFDKSIVMLVQTNLFQIHAESHSVKGKQIFLHRTVQDCIRWHHKKTCDNKYFLCALRELLKYEYSPHVKLIFKYGEQYLDTICTFYQENEFYMLYKNISLHATPKVFRYLLEKSELIRDPKFLSLVGKLRQNLKEILKEYNVNFDVEDEEGLTAFYFVCVSHNIKTSLKNELNAIQSLIEFGANINYQNSFGNTVLHNLCEFGTKHFNAGFFKSLYVFKSCTCVILKGADVKIVNNKLETASDIANRHNLRSTAKFLDLSTTSDVILHALAKCECFSVFKDVIRYNICDINAQDSQGCTVLHVMCDIDKYNPKYEKQIATVINEIMEYNKLNFTIKNKNGETAQDICRQKGLKKIFHLINSSISLDNFCNTYNDVINKFIKQDDVNFQDKDGNTLLHKICDLEKGDYEEGLVKYVLQLVLDRWNEVDKINKKGLKAKDIARRRSRPFIADLLQIKYNKCSAKNKRIEFAIEKAINHDNIDLLIFILLKYRLTSLSGYKYPIGKNIVSAFCGSRSDVLSDEDIINFDLIQFVEFSEDIYNSAIDTAVKAGRKKLVKWLNEQRELNEDRSGIFFHLVK